MAAALVQLGATPEMVEGMLGSWGGYLQQASFTGYLCFAHPATWLRKPPAKIENEKAFDLLTTRYLGAYGPTTARDLGHW